MSPFQNVFLFIQVAQMIKDKRGSTRDGDRSQVKQDLGKISSSSTSLNAPFNMRGDRKGVLI